MLVLSRAIGDHDLKRFGVIATPEVVVHQIRRPNNGSNGPNGSGSDGSKRPAGVDPIDGSGDGGSGGGEAMIVMGSDGLWDTMSNR